MSLALCLMMKNEEEFLEEFFQNCFADNIYVLDTGSTDNSMVIANKYTENIYQKKFNGDFSYMRNFLMEKVKEEWILFLDADERLIESEWNKIRKFISQKNNVGGYRFLRYNFFGTGGWYSDAMVKLFKNGCGFRYDKKATEKIEPSIVNKGFQVENLPVILNHLGYIRPYGERQAKNLKYVEIMEEQIHQTPEDSLAKSYLAIIQRNAGDWRGAIENAQSSALKNPNNELAQLFLGYIFKSLNELDQAKIQFTKVLKINAQNFRALNALGVLALSNGEFKKAREYFEEASSISTEAIHLKINIGLTYFFDKKYQQALVYFNEVATKNPYFGVLDTLGILEVDNYKSHYYETIANYWGLNTYIIICEKEIENEGKKFLY